MDGLQSRMLFSELYKIMADKVAFIGFRWGTSPPLDPPCVTYIWVKVFARLRHILRV